MLTASRRIKMTSALRGLTELLATDPGALYLKTDFVDVPSCVPQ